MQKPYKVRLLPSVRRMVIKLGSSIVATADGVDRDNVGRLVGEIARIHADGRRDLYVYPGSRTKLWDTCGPEAVLVAAGGRVTDVHGQPIDYARAELQNRGGIVASNGPLHDKVIEVLAPLLGARALPR